MSTETVLTLVLGLVGYLGALLYFAGRVYYEWYYQGFGINYKMLDVGSKDCIFSSYTSVLLTVSILPIAYSIGIYFESRRSFFLLLAILHFVASFIVVPFFWPIKFDSLGNKVMKFIGSKDLIVIANGIIAFLVLLVFGLVSSDRWRGFDWPSNLVRVSPIGFTVTVFLSMFIVLAVVAFIEGNYQSQAAIWEGKMGVRWSQKKGDQKWYIYVVRTSDGRNFIFSRTEQKPTCVRDDEIAMIDGPVTGKDP
jgi:hypothetical protein